MRLSKLIAVFVVMAPQALTSSAGVGAVAQFCLFSCGKLAMACGLAAVIPPGRAYAQAVGLQGIAAGCTTAFKLCLAVCPYTPWTMQLKTQVEEGEALARAVEEAKALVVAEKEKEKEKMKEEEEKVKVLGAAGDGGDVCAAGNVCLKEEGIVARYS